MHQQQQQGDGQSFERSVNRGMLICHALAVSVEVFLHRPSTFGERYMGMQVPVAMLILFFFPIFWRGHDPAPLLWFLAAFVVMCAAVRARAVKRRLRGEAQPHSYYSGEPRMLRLARRTPETKVKSMLEPLFVWGASLCVMPVSEPLGTYLLIAGVGLLITVNASVRQERTRSLDLNDALIDQRRIAEQWRGMRRGR